MKRAGYMEQEIEQIVRLSIDAGVSLTPYLCQENFECRYEIARSIRVIREYDITPEKYWKGNKEDFEWLLVLLESDYPSPEELLRIAAEGEPGAIKTLADYYFQHVGVMFEYVKRYKGYDVLQPTPYMCLLYPAAAGKLYVYTSDKWAHKDLSDIGGAFLILDSAHLSQLPQLVSKKVYGY